MKNLMLSMTLTLASSMAFANDGGIAAIKVDQIKMRQTDPASGETVTKIAVPNYEITFEGGEAEKLQKILPSQTSVITSMYPKQAKAYNESFKTLGIYSDKSAAATSKSVTISCSNAKLTEGNEVAKTGKTVCTIRIAGSQEGYDVTDSYGDMQKFEPKTCK